MVKCPRSSCLHAIYDLRYCKVITLYISFLFSSLEDSLKLIQIKLFCIRITISTQLINPIRQSLIIIVLWGLEASACLVAASASLPGDSATGGRVVSAEQQCCPWYQELRSEAAHCRCQRNGWNHQRTSHRSSELQLELPV